MTSKARRRGEDKNCSGARRIGSTSKSSTRERRTKQSRIIRVNETPSRTRKEGKIRTKTKGNG